MWQNFVPDASFFTKLLNIDREEAERFQQRGCPFCGGPLHQAHYPRKPRGVTDGIDDSHRLRFSFCCGSEGCRKRVTPPSTRFLGRKVYFAPVILLLCAINNLLSSEEKRKQRVFSQIPKLTQCRWRYWWQEQFPSGRAWLMIRGRLKSPPEPHELPSRLLSNFDGHPWERLISCLRLLAPVTTTLAITI
jgi:hypothetical protein